MLEFTKTADTYHIRESIMGFCDTKVKTVDYKFDLSEKRVNNEPWRKTNQSDRDWFNKCYRSKFNP